MSDDYGINTLVFFAYVGLIVGIPAGIYFIVKAIIWLVKHVVIK